MVIFTSKVYVAAGRSGARPGSGFGGGRMKEFECTACKKKWYSAAKTTKPCETCGGVLVETTSYAGRTVRRFQLITNEKLISGSKPEDS